MCLETNRYNDKRGRELLLTYLLFRSFFSRCKALRVKFLSSNTILRFWKIMIVNSNLGLMNV